MFFFNNNPTTLTLNCFSKMSICLSWVLTTCWFSILKNEALRDFNKAKTIMNSCSVGGDSAVAKHVGCFLLSGNVKELASVFTSVWEAFSESSEKLPKDTVCCLSTIYCGNQSVWRHKDGLHFVFVYECDKVSFWMKAEGLLSCCILLPQLQNIYCFVRSGSCATFTKHLPIPACTRLVY